MKYLALFFLSIISIPTSAEIFFNYQQLKESSLQEIHLKFPNTKDNDFVLVDLDINTKSKILDSSYFEIGFVDKNSLHSDKFSKFAYDRYIVSFNILSGKFHEVKKGGWGSYQDVSNSEIKNKTNK